MWMGTKLRRIEQKLDALRVEVAAFRQDEAREDEKMSQAQDEVLELVRQAKTVSEATNVGVRAAIQLLKDGQQQDDPAKTAEAKSLLEAMIADDNALLKENTPEFTPSGN